MSPIFQEVSSEIKDKYPELSFICDENNLKLKLSIFEEVNGQGNTIYTASLFISRSKEKSFVVTSEEHFYTKEEAINYIFNFSNSQQSIIELQKFLKEISETV